MLNFFYFPSSERHLFWSQFFDVFFLFLLQKEFYMYLGSFSDFFLFLLKKDFDTFHVLLCKTFLFFMIFMMHFYICIQKNYIKNLLVIYHLYIYIYIYRERERDMYILYMYKNFFYNLQNWILKCELCMLYWSLELF